jgi:cob(I)alamin adenosyltransferase
VETYGSIDELNAALGMARVTAEDPFIAEQILAVQKELIICDGRTCYRG